MGNRQRIITAADAAADRYAILGISDARAARAPKETSRAPHHITAFPVQRLGRGCNFVDAYHTYLSREVYLDACTTKFELAAIFNTSTNLRLASKYPIFEWGGGQYCAENMAKTVRNLES